MPLFPEIWTVMGAGLSHPNFTQQVDLVAISIFSQYSFHGQVTGTEAGVAAPVYLDGMLGAPACLVPLVCIQEFFMLRLLCACAHDEKLKMTANSHLVRVSHRLLLSLLLT